jgi:hypothetical protein
MLATLTSSGVRCRMLVLICNQYRSRYFLVQIPHLASRGGRHRDGEYHDEMSVGEPYEADVGKPHSSVFALVLMAAYVISTAQGTFSPTRSHIWQRVLVFAAGVDAVCICNQYRVLSVQIQPDPISKVPRSTASDGEYQ